MSQTPDEALDCIMGIGMHGAEQAQFDHPDSDWTPYVLIATEEDKRVLIELDLEFFRDDVTRTVLAQMVLPEMAKGNHAKAIAILSSTWVSKRELDELEGRPMPRDDPERMEAVIVVGCTTQRQIYAMAEMTRTDDEPPTLGEWMVMDSANDENPMQVAGFLINALSKALGGREVPADA